MARISRSTFNRKLRLNGQSFSDLPSWLDGRRDRAGSSLGRDRGRSKGRRRGRSAASDTPSAQVGVDGSADSNAQSAGLAVRTDKADYAPGAIATFTATGVSPGGELVFSLKDDPNDPGDDGDRDDYGSFAVVDGGAADLDGQVNGTVVATWTVPRDDDGSGTGIPDALNATLELSVKDVRTGAVATTTFTDAGAITAGAITDVDETAGLQADAPTIQQDPGAVAGQVDGGVERTDFTTALTNGSPQDAGALTTLRGLRDFGDGTTFALSGASDANSAGANAVNISVPNVTNLKLAQNSSGNPFSVYSGSLAGGIDSGLEAISGGPIYLFQDSANDNLVLGYTSNGDLTIALYLQEVSSGGQVSGAKLWLISYEPIKHSSTAKDETATITNLYASLNAGADFDLNTLASGQNVWNAFGDANYQVIVMSDEAVSRGQTVNTSKGGGSTTIGNTNQLIEGRNPDKDADGEAMSFTFTQASPDLLTADKRIFTSIAPTSLYDARTVSWSISQTQGGGNYAVATIKAYSTSNESGQAFADDVDRSVSPNNDASVSVDEVSIKDGGGNLIIAASRSGGDASTARTAGNTHFTVTIDFRADGTVEISGLREKDTITYSTAALHNRVIFQNTGIASGKTNSATTLDWDIGSFEIADAQSATTQLTVRVEDDAPSIAAAVVGIDTTVRLDDDAVTGAGGNAGGFDDDIDAINAAGNLNYAPGFDGLQSVVFLDSGAPAGFSFLKSGSDLLIKQGATTVLTLTLDSASGAYTVTQNAPINHATGLNENNIEFTVTYRVTDLDGDFVDGTLVINVDDDAPTPVAITAISGTVDEEGNGGNALPDGSNGDVSGTATSFSTGNLASLFNAGADTPLSFSFAATTSAAIAAAIAATGTASGNNQLTSGGTVLTYAVSGNTLTASAGASTVFSLSINTPATGGFSFNLAGHLDHASANGENDLVLSLGALIKATDFDGDEVTANASALQITVDDDAPTPVAITAISGTVDEEGNGGNALPDGSNGDVSGTATSFSTGNLASLFNAGADTPLSFSFAATTSAAIAAAIAATGTASGNNQLTSGGTVLTYAVSGNTLTASAGASTVFSLSINTPATGGFSFNLAGHLDHASANGENDLVLSLGALIKATEFDGDEVTANASALQITVDDDAPTPVAITAISGTVDEEGNGGNALPDGSNGDVSGTATSFSTGNLASLFNAGADTPLSFSFAATTSAAIAAAIAATGTASGNNQLTSGGTVLTYAVSGNTLTASAGASTVFSLSINTPATGGFSFNLAGHLDHASANGENDLVLSLGALIKATDFDGDEVTANASALQITVDDDAPTPVAITAISGTVDEEGNGGNALPDGSNGDVSGTATSFSTGNLASLFNAGADTPLSFSFAATTSAAIAAAIAATGTASGNNQLTSGGTVLTYAVSGNTLTASAGASTVFSLSINTPATGGFSFNLAGHLDHASANGENDLVLSLGALIKATDFDGDEVTANASALQITVDDDTPLTSGAIAILLDDDALTGGNADGANDDPNSVNASGTLGFNFGADSGGTVTFLQTGAPAGFTYNLSGSDLLIKQGTNTVLTLSLNSGTGAYSVVQNAPIQDPAGDNENNVTFTVTYEVNDKDGDKATNTFTINVDDDSPMLMATPGNPGNAVPASTTPNAYSGSGSYAYSIGSDRRSSYSASNSDFVLPLLSGYAGTSALINPTVSWVSESSTQATFNFAFSYKPNPNGTAIASESGTLTFDKVNGTYNINLSALDSYVEFLTTSNPSNKFVEYQVPLGGSGSPEVVTIELRSDFFVQFTGDRESGGGSPKLFVSGGDSAYAEGETISAADASVLVSSVAQGVGGNTVQSPEVLDFNFFTTNPLNDTTKASDRNASGLFLKFDGFGGEDMVVILKLMDPSTGATTTRALVIDPGDMYTNKPGSTPPSFYPISLDNNDAAVIIERNDYCFGSENWRISGAQILASTQKLTGSGINFNRATGATGGSSGTQVFSKDTNSVNGTEDGDVFKIIELGFVTENNPTPQVLLNFAVQVEDTDGDRTALSNLGVAITGAISTGTAAADVLTGTAAGDTFSGLAGTDRFVLPNLASSLLPNFDVITDYSAGESIQAPGAISASLTTSVGQATDLSATAIAAVLTAGTFGANQAAAFTLAGLSGTFVALNDSNAGFQSGSDAVLFLQGYAIGAANPVTVI